MKYYYSKGTGLSEIGEDSPLYDIAYDTEEKAIIGYYIVERQSRVQKVYDRQRELKSAEEALKDLDKTFGYLKEKFPEEFI